MSCGRSPGSRPSAHRDRRSLRCRALDYAFSGKVRTQDQPGFLGTLLFSPFARAQAWPAVKSHWADLTRDVPTAVGAFTGSVGSFCDAEAKKDIETFFA